MKLKDDKHIIISNIIKQGYYYSRYNLEYHFRGYSDKSDLESIKHTYQYDQEKIFEKYYEYNKKIKLLIPKI